MKPLRALILSTAVLCGFAPPRASAVVAPGTAARPSVATELETLQTRDEAARQDMSRWLRETEARDDQMANRSPHFLSARMEHRFGLVCAAYTEFLRRHPGHAEAAAQEATFRADITEDLEAIRRWETGRAEDPTSPAPWNELAHYLVHNGRTTDGLTCFERSLELSPREAVYFFDYATSLLLYRSDAARHYQLTEPELFERVLTLCRRGLRLEPDSFHYAAEFARTFYLVKPARPAEALAAWNHAFKVAETEADADEVRTHLARHAIHAGNMSLARVYLVQMTDPRLDTVKESLLRKISEAAKAEKTVPAPASE